jgi:protein gp37
MGETTGIAWTDHTFNPWIGCTKVHAGCANCYAETLATTRLGRKWGAGAERRVTAPDNWKQPLRWARAAVKAGVRQRVFCASLADVLDVEAPEGAREALWDLIRKTAGITGLGLDWQILTKRPERWEIIPKDVRRWVWFGTSISDQKTADEWGGRLLRARGFRLLFLSYEPAIGPANLTHLLPDLGWVIMGGESGAGARPYGLEWARSAIAQCRAAGVPFFHKQAGAEPFSHNREADDGREWWAFHDKKGGDPSEWPEDLRVRQFPFEAR